MTLNRTASFWDLNKASVFIDAVNVANSQPRCHYYPAPCDASPEPSVPAGTGWVRKMVTISTLAMFGGLMMVNWIA